MNACQKSLDSLSKRRKEIVTTTGTLNLATPVSRSSLNQSLLSESKPRNDITQDTTPLHNHDYSNELDIFPRSLSIAEDGRENETYQTLSMLVSTTKTHRIMAITSSITKPVDVYIAR